MTLALFPVPSGPAQLHRGALRRWSFAEVRAALDFQQASTTMYGNTYNVPRLEAWYGLQPYRYGGQVQQPKPWPAELHAICDEVESLLEHGPRQSFDSCFANLYEDGSHTINWHADDDGWIGPWIVSVSFGARRDFVMRHKRERKVKWSPVTYSLGHGDVLVMPPGTQDDWEHHVPRRKRVTRPRINLTFRQTLGPHPLRKGPKRRGVAP